MLGADGTAAQAAAWLVAHGPSLALVTDGGGDVGFATAEGDSGCVPSASVAVVDTTGAGDIFYGTCLYELLKGGLDRKDGRVTLPTQERIAYAVRRAVAAAGISVTRKGAIPSIPSYAEIQSIPL